MWKNWFRRNRRQESSATDGGLHLGTGERRVVRRTASADTLARDLLEKARDEHVNTASGTTVTVTIPPGNQHIHHMELMVCFMALAPEYGFTAGIQINNTQDLIKN